MQNVQAVQLRAPSRSAPPPKIRGGHSSITSMGSPFLWRGTVSQCPPLDPALVLRLASPDNANYHIRCSNNAHEF